VVNYLYGFSELNLNTTEMEAHFGPALIAEARAIIAKEKEQLDKSKEVVATL
jgi:hypothetical protein